MRCVEVKSIAVAGTSRVEMCVGERLVNLM